MISRHCKWHAFYAQFSLLMSMLLVLSGCTLTRGASTQAAPTRTRLPETPSPIRAFFGGPLTCLPTKFFSDKSLVLATDRLTYDQAEVNQLTDFIDTQGDGAGRLDGPALPETLRYITGSATISILSKDQFAPGEPVDSTPCSVALELANISQETLQIPQVHLRYLSNAEPNTQVYRLINVCSIGLRTQGTCPFGGAGPQSGYVVGFAIGRGSPNTVYSDKPQSLGGGPGEPPLPAIPTLRPGDATVITIGVGVKNYESGLFVAAIPEVVVRSPDKTQTVALTQLNMDIAIAAPRNVSCYALKGNTFVQQTPLVSRPEGPGGGSWCV